MIKTTTMTSTAPKFAGVYQIYHHFDAPVAGDAGRFTYLVDDAVLQHLRGGRRANLAEKLKGGISSYPAKDKPVFRLVDDGNGRYANAASSFAKETSSLDYLVEADRGNARLRTPFSDYDAQIARIERRYKATSQRLDVTVHDVNQDERTVDFTLNGERHQVRVLDVDA